MDTLDRWDVLLLVAAALVAINALVRLMSRRRRQLIGELGDEASRSGKARDDGRDEGRDERSDRGEAA